ncbi:MAG TPA: hypothetical protein HA232_03715 [Methanocellales archaeon]|nr:hypothetical protein [Methanocellales archaeon]
MPRVSDVGNGRLAATFDDQTNVRDIFYPCMGSENHISIHVLIMGGRTLHLGDGWHIETKYMPKTLVSRSHYSHPGQEIQIVTNDALYRAHDELLMVRSEGEEQKLYYKRGQSITLHEAQDHNNRP